MLQSRFLKISFVIAIFILGPCACNPCGEVPLHFIVQSIDAENYHVASNSFEMRSIEANVVLDWDEYALMVPFNVEYTAHLGGTGFAAYATSCVEKGERGANTGLKEIFVIAENDYNVSYHKNDTVNEMVSIGARIDYMMSMAEFKSQNTPVLFAQQAIIKLKEAPANDLDFYQFKVVVHLLNGDVFSATCSPVMLEK